MSEARILIVEDNLIEATDIQATLQQLNYEVVGITSSSKEAIQKIEEILPDLVLMDIGLRGKHDGIYTTEQIRTRFDIPVIYLTAHADEETLQRAKLSAPFGYVLKPFESRELHIHIEIALYKHRVEKQLTEHRESLRQELERQVEERTAELVDVNRKLQLEIRRHTRTEAVLREVEACYRTIADFTYDWEYWEGVDGFLRYMSPVCEHITGYTVQEFMKAPDLLDRLIVPEDKSVWHGHRQAATETPGRHGVQFRIRRKDGAIRWIEHACQAVIDEKGAFYGYRVSNRDITERKQAEEALRISERQYRLLAEHVAEGIGIIQTNQLVFVNPGLASLLDSTPLQLLGKDPCHMLPDDVGRYFEKLCQQIEHHPCETDWRRLEFVVKTGTREIWLEGRHSSIIWGNKPATLITLRDISQRKQLEIEIEREKESLRQENIQLRYSMQDRYKLGEIIGKSVTMQNVYEQILHAAASETNVLISGESGTGKELVAWTIHRMSPRSEKAFIPVNCGAIPETLFESEFFGYRKGAFTGAHSDKQGFFDAAHRGTLFLDEVSELSPAMQAKLLRALAGGGYTPVGDYALKKADVRIIAATNKNLREQVQKREMREDFYYRIHVISIMLPPLRDRKEDIPLLIDHFLRQFRVNAQQTPLSGKILQQLYEYDWPGNIRELENVLQRYLTTNSLDFIAPYDVKKSVESEPAFEYTGLQFSEAMNAFEKQLILSALKHNHWKRSKTAKELGVSRRSLYRKLEKHGII